MCRAYGASSSSPMLWPPACCHRPMAIPAAYAAPPGCGGRRKRGERALPRMRRTHRFLRREGAVRRLRLAADRRASRARRARHRAYRLRRVLRHRREARPAGHRGAAGHCRRAAARRRARLLLCCAALRCALGDADVPGAGALPACRGDPAGHGEIPRCRPRGARRDAARDATRRAAVDRRGISRPDRYRAGQRRNAGAFLADKPVGLLWGVGAAMQHRLAADGIALIGQLRALDDRELARRYGKMGARLARLARGDDFRHVEPVSRTKSISAETTFARDESDAEALARTLWPLCEEVSARLKTSGLAAGTVTLKLKTSDFRIRTRSRKLPDPSQLADTLFRTARHLLAVEADGATRFRLIGIGADSLTSADTADLPTLFDREDGKPRRLERALDDIRSRHGGGAVKLGRVV